MSVFAASLNSGSNGNSYYVGNDDEAILIDAGISCRETEKRMSGIGLTMNKVKALFITHEHTDHTRGAEVLSRKYRLPVYITPATLRNSATVLESTLIRAIQPGKEIMVGKLKVTPFTKNHDAIDPVSFFINNQNTSVSVITDIGVACPEVIRYFSKSHAAFLEANYDESMLEQGNYPYHLKRRIRSDKGHLSNNQALELFLNHRSPCLSHLFLSHLSKENNCPDLVHRLFNAHCGNAKIVVASRYQATGVFHISGNVSDTGTVAEAFNFVEKKQLELFG